MKFLIAFIFIVTAVWQDEVEVTHYRKDLVGKTHIGDYNISITQEWGEDNMDMIHRGYDSAVAKAKTLDGTMVYINGRRWRYMGRKLVVITEIYKD